MTEEQAQKLIEQNASLIDEVTGLRKENTTLRQELQQQKDIIEALLKRLYGTSSEKMSTDQLLLAFLKDEPKKPEAADGPEEPPAANSKAKKKPRTTRPQKLKDSLKSLPTVTKEIIPAEVLAHPASYRRIGEEVSERLKVSPNVFTRHLTIRPTYVKKDELDTAPITAPLEPSLLPGSILTPSLGAYLLTEKFCYHQPFQRLEWRLRAAHGIELSRGMMCHYHNHLAETLLPLYHIIARKLRESDYLKVDETPIDYLDPGKGKTSTGQLWTYHHSEHGVLFDWHTSRANTCLDNILIGKENEISFNGHLQSDGLRAYRAFIERFPENTIIPVSCLAHIRRKFVEAKGDHPKLTAWILYLIGKLYLTEQKCREEKVSHAERKRRRQKHSRRIYDHLSKLFNHLAKRRSILPKSRLGKALNYAWVQWTHLQPCFEGGQIELDNNLTENAIRPTKLGAKNWMFIGGADTGWRSAVIYTFIEQIRTHGKDPFAYLEWVFEKLITATNQDNLEALLPSSWLATQNQQTKAA